MKKKPPENLGKRKSSLLIESFVIKHLWMPNIGTSSDLVYTTKGVKKAGSIPL